MDDRYVHRGGVCVARRRQGGATHHHRAQGMRTTMRRLLWSLVFGGCVLGVGGLVSAGQAQPGQGRGGGPGGGARAAAPVDLTGVWVSVVTEDWRWRMRTPPKGDYA